MSALLCGKFKHLKCQINATGMFSQMLPLRGPWISALWLSCTKPLAHLHENIYKVSVEVMREDVKAEETSSRKDPGIILRWKYFFVYIHATCLQCPSVQMHSFYWGRKNCSSLMDSYLAVEFGHMAFCNVTNKADIYSWKLQSLKCLQIRSVSGSDRALNHIMLSLLQIVAF